MLLQDSFLEIWFHNQGHWPEAVRCFSRNLTGVGPSTRAHALLEWTGCFSMTGGDWSSPSLRTDAAKRGLCISFITLEIVVLAVSFWVSIFFFIREY